MPDAIDGANDWSVWWGERHSPATTDLPITMRLAEPPEPFDWLRSMTRRSRHAAGRATDREIGVVAAVLVTGSEKAAADRAAATYGA